MPEYPHFILEESEHFDKSKMHLTNEEKISLLSNQDIWYSAKYKERSAESALTSGGMRSLEEYGFKNDEFLETIANIQRNTGKTRLNLLDVGGAGGIMLNDAKKLDSSIITCNMTLDVQPVTFDFDKLYLCPAERFPNELRENMDLILSNMAFCYMPGQACALENCLQALSVGGEAYLSVDWGKQHSFIKNSANKLFKQYKRFQELNTR
jgi:SAM-dependent methyltransferase